MIFAIDMDGTCLDRHNRISNSTLDALRNAAAAGIEIVPTTGRALSCLPHQLKQERFYRYVITSNGSKLTDTKTDAALYDASIPRSTAKALLRQCQGKQIGVTVHVENHYYIQGKPLWLLGRMAYGQDAKNAVIVKNAQSLLESEDRNVEEIQLFHLTKTAKENVRSILGQFPNLTSAQSLLYTEIYAADAAKGAALRVLARHLGEDKSGVACIGDAENDISMFQASSVRFAMGNAIPTLKNLADVVVADRDHSGVAQAVEYLLSQDS